MSARLWATVMWIQVRRTMLHSDDAKIRWLMALSSLGWSLVLWMPWDTFDRPAYTLMRWAPEWLWGLAFFLHGAGAIWRILDPVKRVRWAQWINGLGFGVWFLSTLLLNFGAEQLAAHAVLEAISCVFLFMVWIGTGLVERSHTA